MRRIRNAAGRARPKQITVRMAIPMLGDITGVWEPVEAERKAAWELYAELATRVSTVELGPEDGFLREALSSFYSLFGTTRDILRRYGPDVAPRRGPGSITFGALAVTVLNQALRPVLATWHPRLAAYESLRPADVDPVSYERGWEHAAELRAEIARVREVLVALAHALSEVAGSADLLRPATMPYPPPGGRRGVTAGAVSPRVRHYGCARACAGPPPRTARVPLPAGPAMPCAGPASPRPGPRRTPRPARPPAGRRGL
ncbi:hypothetical protein [Streptomyces hiroshimensis]|uniref:Uncharacterized protein n=1 Tax=Streptomyces hiroshimensis TaxID=66424 RepID=A0ABQ2YTQ0_9ACTN|nr:hypothetical protein [Streptomyces hiroshimensis]GGX95067.1 hypothetical protein GCM10010324_46320 [Streptomyces hiroshimensis]